MFVDAKVEKVSDGGRVARTCVVIAHAVHETGRREIISLDVGAAETEAFCASSSAARSRAGLTGVQVAISNARAGLNAALATVLGAPGSEGKRRALLDRDVGGVGGGGAGGEVEAREQVVEVEGADADLHPRFVRGHHARRAERPGVTPGAQGPHTGPKTPKRNVGLPRL